MSVFGWVPVRGGGANFAMGSNAGTGCPVGKVTVLEADDFSIYAVQEQHITLTPDSQSQEP